MRLGDLASLEAENPGPERFHHPSTWCWGYTSPKRLKATYPAPKSNTGPVYLKGQGLIKLVISRVIIRVTPFRALITLLITYLLSPLPLKVDFKVSSFEVQGLRLLGFGVAWCSEPPSERKYPFPKRKNRRSPRSPSKLPTVNPQPRTL